VATAQYAVTSALGFGFGIEHVADGILRLRKAIISGVLKRLLIIEKMRQTNHDRRVFEVEVRNGEGLVIVKPVEISGDALRRLSPLPYFEEGELRF
jgi:KaiC/GvpD/RAD55 family RecA-like ATPase